MFCPKRKILQLIILFLALGLFAFSPPVWSQEQERVSMDFKDVDIQVFIKFISDLTDRNFIVGDNVQGKITVISPKKVTPREAYKVFESVLEVHGYTTVPSGEATKIVRAVKARKKDVSIQTGSKGVEGARDRIITQVIPLEHASSQDLRKILTPMASKQGQLVDYSPANTLILTDYESNIQRILKIVNQVDKKGIQTTLEVYSLEHAEASTVARGLNNIMKARKQAQGRAAPFIHSVANERINSVVVLAEVGIVQEAKDFISKLDQPTPKGESQVHVVSLDNAVAADLAEVLSSLATGKGKKGKPIISQNVQVSADKASNSLVITAKKEEFQALKTVIEELDQPRAQVYVEAAIMEVSTDTSLNFGINWQGAAELGSEGIAAGSINQPLSLPTAEEAIGNIGQDVDGTGASLGVLSFPFQFGKNTYYSLSSFIQASQTDNQVDIISTPQLMTMENEQAKVVVAENRPFITSREIREDTDREFSNIEYKDVGVTLKVTPQINEQGSVKMDVYQEVSRVDPSALQGVEEAARTPVTRKRTAETRVEVQDGQTAVIAGLIEEKSTQVDTGVPILSQVPGLGWLFKHRDQTETKKNLMVFLTPRVVRSEQDMERIWSEKKERMDRLSYGIEGKVESLSAPFQVAAPVQLEQGGGS